MYTSNFIFKTLNKHQHSYSYEKQTDVRVRIEVAPPGVLLYDLGVHPPHALVVDHWQRLHVRVLLLILGKKYHE